MPIWIADYVLMSYGTSAIMAVPAHDERDWALPRSTSSRFEKRFKVDRSTRLPSSIRIAAVSSTPPRPTGPGSIDGLLPSEAIPPNDCLVGSCREGKKTVNYKLRDWLFARQRYWGEPFHRGVDGEPRPLPEELPCRETKNFKPSGAARARWPILKTGCRPRTLSPANRRGARRTPCRSGPAPVGITCGSSTRRIPVRWLIR